MPKRIMTHFEPWRLDATPLQPRGFSPTRDPQPRGERKTISNFEENKKISMKKNHVDDEEKKVERFNSSSYN
jgi:hypothetical protein